MKYDAFSTSCINVGMCWFMCYRAKVEFEGKCDFCKYVQKLFQRQLRFLSCPGWLETDVPGSRMQRKGRDSLECRSGTWALNLHSRYHFRIGPLANCLSALTTLGTNYPVTLLTCFMVHNGALVPGIRVGTMCSPPCPR